MDEGRPYASDEDQPESKPDGRVDEAASRARLRRLPADLSRLSSEEIAAAATAMSIELGAVEPSYAQIAAVEHLNEMRASGAVSEENYLREKRRILGQA